MATVGYFLSSEEHGPRALLNYAVMGEESGFHDVFISDHYHPWLGSQGQSPFVWSVVGAIGARTRLRVTTGVTCPTVRVHPAVLAQAAATSQVLLDGRFRLGVGSGEALNEHITGVRWPPAPVRLEMLQEAVAVMRKLWEGGEVTHYGPHYVVENARLYTLPEEPPPVLMSGFGPRAVEMAANDGDGYVTVVPDTGSLERWREAGGRGPAVAATKVCWGQDEAKCRHLAFDKWRVNVLPGELNQDLPVPAHFEQASELVTEDMVAEAIPCGPDPERHAKSIASYLEAGFDEVHVSQVGDDQAGFLRFFWKEVVPRLGL
jgi:G6PDH family F420-dependent oxidoreductase